MLKSLAPIEPELVRLCRSKTWLAMTQRCETHPDEAKPTTLAMQGASTTGLAIAVRSGAPIGAIQVLIRANVSQLGVVHKFSGSILHEALKHRASYDVLRSLLQAVFQYEHVSLLGRQDQQKRNVLHNMVVRVMKELEEDGDYDGMWILFRDMVLSYPQAIRVMDADGNTPLVLALLIPGVNISVHSKKEVYMFRMVQLMVTTCPSAATVARKTTPRHWKRFGSKNASNSPSTTGDGAPNSLTYAILYGRWESTVRLLFDAYRQIGKSAGMTIVSGYHEVPLHLAITMRSPMTLLEQLVKSDPDAIRVRDMNGLTPLDWLWIRHVIDWCSTEPAAALPVELRKVMPSTRRYLSSHFAAWHDRATHEMNAIRAVHRRELLDMLLDRISLLLPTVAKTSTTAPRAPKRDVTWSLLHSSCAVSCPLAVVRLSYQQNPESLGTQDVHAGRLPLHYAAARTGYRASVPVGVSREVRTMEEPSAAMEVASKFVQATRVVDNNYQLPLHIAIETAKETFGDDGEAEAVTKLLHLYPDSLERRDGMTKLFPFLQASEGPKASLNMTFMLLRKHPTLVSSALH